MSKSNKSAKDIAFDKERAKYRQQIHNLESELRKKDAIISEQASLIQEKESKLLEVQDWVQRLLEYTELSETEMREIINNEKKKAAIMNDLKAINSIFGILGRGEYM